MTWGDIANTFDESRMSENPVMYVAATGLTPMFPVMTDAGTVEIPLFARMTKPPEVPRFTADGEPMPPPLSGLIPASFPLSILVPPSLTVPLSGLLPPSVFVPPSVAAPPSTSFPQSDFQLWTELFPSSTVDFQLRTAPGSSFEPSPSSEPTSDPEHAVPSETNRNTSPVFERFDFVINVAASWFI